MLAVPAWRTTRPRTFPETTLNEGAGRRIRTDDLLITNQLLYQLSYAGVTWATMAAAGGLARGKDAVLFRIPSTAEATLSSGSSSGDT